MVKKANLYACVFTICLLIQQTPALSSEWEGSASTDTYLCGSADIKAFFVNYKKSACVAYNWTTETGSMTLTIGLGLGAGAGLEIPGFGASADVSLGQRVKVTIKGKKTKKQIVSACREDSKDGKEFRAMLLKLIKEELLKLNDAELQKAGASRAKIEAMKELPAFDLILADKDKSESFEKLLKDSQKLEE